VKQAQSTPLCVLVQTLVNASVTAWLRHTSLLVRIAKSSRFYQQVAVLKLQQRPEGK
jgi:hypothetical protein